jgi:NADH-quinone oxidoreductase subunit L
MGFPLSSGFFSKDAILYAALTGPHGSKGLWMMGALAAVFTAFYVGRFFFKTFHGRTRLDHHAYEHAHESAWPMAAPLILLAAGSLAVGALGMPKFMSKAQPLEDWLAPVFADVTPGGGATPPAASRPAAPEAAPAVAGTSGQAHPQSGTVAVAVASAPDAQGKPEQGEDVGLTLKLMAFYTSVIAFMIWLTFKWFARESATPNAVAAAAAPIHQLLWNKYYIDEFYDLVFVRGLLGFSKLLLRVVDQGLIDGAVNAVGQVAQAAGAGLRLRAQNGNARFYAGALLAGVVLLLGMVLTFSL